MQALLRDGDPSQPREVRTDEGAATTADLGNTYRPLAAHAHALPTCPKCQKFISEGHYQRHLQRCGTTHGHESQSLSSAKAHTESSDRGTTHGPAGEDRGGINWTKVAAVLVIFLLIGSLVAFFILYALSLL